ncbi:APC family permease [Streptomyces sp. SID8352]|uniref:amino acid permease n=1 Tax=Streptomyces sp. SID8352 TaxID=2690338 RepID=UPI00136B3FDD|nr:amino acid permease [Streptomyces sp. SID8352]
MKDLHKSLGGVVGTFLALSTILGSGMMILPGTSYDTLARSAWMPWAVAALAVVPLLHCYAWLGRRYPSASGVAHYAGVAFNPVLARTSGTAATFALVAGIPATALTGGRYLAEFTGAEALTWLFPALVLGVATAVAYAGTGVSGRLQVALVIALFVLIVCVALVALGSNGVRTPATRLPPSGTFGMVLTSVFVAFTGWETVAFTFEEHKRPDIIPRVFAASYVIVVALYGLLLLSLFATVDPDADGLRSAPLLLLAERALGDVGRPVALVLVTGVITANVLASVLALSRLVFGMARSGHLPAALARLRERDGNPVTAVVAVGALLVLIAVLSVSGLVPLEHLFTFSGGIYFVLYGVGAAAFARLATGMAARAVTVLCAVTVLGVTLLAGPPMWLCWGLFAVLAVTVLATRRRNEHVPASERTGA